MTAACNFIALEEKMRELLDKNRKRKKKRKEENYCHMIGQKKAQNLRVVSQWFLAKLNESWQADSKFQGAQFSKNFYRWFSQWRHQIVKSE